MSPLLDLVRAVIFTVAVQHGINPDSLDALARCESTYNPLAVNGQYWGLMQLGPAHRARFLAAGYDDVWSAEQQASYTADVIVAEGAGAWECGRGLDWRVRVVPEMEQPPGIAHRGLTSEP